jgi:hypothetical protein
MPIYARFARYRSGPCPSRPPYLEACLSVLYRACINGRLIGWSGEQSGLTATQSGELADRMDAVHNIPCLVQNWEKYDEPLLRQFLATFDEKWKAGGHGNLLAAYEDVLARRAAPSAEGDPETVFELRSVHGGASLLFEGRVPRGLEGYDGTTYSARICGPVTASGRGVRHRAPPMGRVIRRSGKELARMGQRQRRRSLSRAT